jgi:NAD(P)-dependent dehydrogenase (short-subunit alcohol dehydrogenase family)
MSSYLVTGASRGLGLATVAFLASSPETDVKVVFATVRSETAALKKLAEESSGRIVVVKLDITDQASVDDGVKVVEERLGNSGLDVLINNAGAIVFAPGWTDQM